ncbi:MAG TPA: peptidylprolyl isomerase [Candidatus Dormibacteraeota bacterium]
MLATLGILAAAILAFAVYLGRTLGPVAAPVAVATPTPTPVTTVSDCSSLHFGSPLAPTDDNAGKRSFSAPPAMAINTSLQYLVTIVTNKGTMTLCLQPALAPNTVNNFVFLARNKFYDGLKWHRVVADFVIQGGDPKGDGTGGPGYKFNDEPVKGQYTAGAVAMANSGPNTNGSQFFICTVDDTSKLQKLYNLFGYVNSGMDVVLKIAQGDTMTSVTVQEQVP